MEQEQRFKPIHLRHPTSYHTEHPDVSRGQQIQYDGPAESSLLDIQYQRQLQDLNTAQISDAIRHRNRLHTPEYTATPSSPSTSSGDLYLDRPATFASHIQHLPSDFQPVSPLDDDSWPSEHHLTHLLGGRDPSHQEMSGQNIDPRNRASRSQPPLSQSAPTDAFFDYSFPATPTNSVTLHPSSYTGSPTRSTAISNDLDNINLGEMPDVYGTSMESAASSSYSFGIQTPPVAANAPNNNNATVSAAATSNTTYQLSPAFRNAQPTAKTQAELAEVTDLPTEPTVQKTVQKKYERRRRRRESHNAVERRRREHINDRIQELGALLPHYMLLDSPSSPLQSGGAPSGLNQDFSFVNGKPSKATILSKSVDHIKELKSDAERYQQRIRELEEALRASNQRESQWNTRMIRPSSRSPNTHMTPLQYNHQTASYTRHRTQRYRPRSHTDPQPAGQAAVTTPHPLPQDPHRHIDFHHTQRHY
ncbi:hypothetical protein BC943DRAFT_359947 [Umbelopsis sp. AD052]|nr:hypothetical protein BC943DRAFT_359947 [Umbelopsis sp. AD052]